MKVVETSIPDVLIIEPKVFGDERGFFYELQRGRFRSGHGAQASVRPGQPLQVPTRRAARAALPDPAAAGKLVRVVAGEVFDVAVDLRLAELRPLVRHPPERTEPAPAVDTRRLRTASWCSAKAPSSSTRPPTTTRLSMSAACCGTTPSSASNGRSTRRHNCPLRTRPASCCATRSCFHENPDLRQHRPAGPRAAVGVGGYRQAARPRAQCAGPRRT